MDQNDQGQVSVHSVVLPRFSQSNQPVSDSQGDTEPEVQLHQDELSKV